MMIIIILIILKDWGKFQILRVAKLTRGYETGFRHYGNTSADVMLTTELKRNMFFTDPYIYFKCNVLR